MTSNYDALVAKLEAGETVTAAALTKAKAEDELAALTIEADANRQAFEVEQARGDRIDEILATLHDAAVGPLREIVDARNAFESATNNFADACERYETIITDAATELRRLGELPEGVKIRTTGGDIRIETPEVHPPEPRALFTSTAAQLVARRAIPTKRTALHRAVSGRYDFDYFADVVAYLDRHDDDTRPGDEASSGD